VFLVSDACFSGDIMETSRGGTSPEFSSDYYRRAYARVSRQVLSSGSSENVPDSSEFALRFKQILQRNEAVCLDPMRIFDSVREVKATQPLLGILPNSGHQSEGSFIFFKRDLPFVAELSAPVRDAAPSIASDPMPKLPIPEEGIPNGEGGGKSSFAKRFLTPSNFWTVGAQVGTAFSAPLVTGAIHGSISFFKYSFLELGLDAGFLSSDTVRRNNPGMTTYYSVNPFAHYNAGWISKNFALYAGAGGGYMFATYNYETKPSRTQNVLAMDGTVGLWFRGFDLSFVLRTDFSGINIKTAAGYSWRF
jgi:hypothetical protein